MAHNAGVKAVGVTYGNGSRKEMEEENTEWIIDDFAEMIDVCNSFL
jgi:phosphoglycolate phosphatase-like HAD superfamily hydrolase